MAIDEQQQRAQETRVEVEYAQVRCATRAYYAGRLIDAEEFERRMWQIDCEACDARALLIRKRLAQQEQ